MPNSCPKPALTAKHQTLTCRARASRSIWLSLAIVVSGILFAATASSQTLARPGWAGSGLNTDPWWKSAVFYDAETQPPAGAATTDFRALTAKLDDLHTLGIDALLLPMPSLPTLPTPQAQLSAQSSALLDDFDELLHQASRVKMRVLLSFTPATPTADLSSMARFWLSRGVAGFHLISATSANPADTRVQVLNLRRITSAAVGQRIVLSDLIATGPATAATAQPARRSARSRYRTRAERQADVAVERMQLQVDPRLSEVELPEAPNLRVILQQTLGLPGDVLQFHPPKLAPGSPDFYRALAKPVAAMLLTLHSAAIIAPPLEQPGGQAAGLFDWYRQLTALHHGNAALRFGTISMLNFDEQNALAWVARPATAGGLTLPVVVVCNLSALPLQLSLEQQLRSLNLRGTYLRTLLLTDKESAPQQLNSVSVPAFGVYVGELKR